MVTGLGVNSSNPDVVGEQEAAQLPLMPPSLSPPLSTQTAFIQPGQRAAKRIFSKA